MSTSVGGLTIVIAMTVVGCGGGGAGTGGSDGGSGGSGGSGASGGGGSGASGGSVETGGSTGGSGTGGSGTGGAFDPADYAGIDTSSLPMGTPPAGCAGGFDAGSKTLSLTLGQDVPGVLLGVVEGELQANGVTCSAEDGTPATIENTRTIEITGTSAAETVVVDLATGTFGEGIFGAEGGIHVDGKGGGDTFAIRGSTGDDDIDAGMFDGMAAFDLSGLGAPNIDVANVGSFLFSLGRGDDRFRGTGIAGGPAATFGMAIFGDADSDDLQGGAGDDALHGGAGDDTFLTAKSADGADVYDGGEGSDTLDYSARTAALTVTMGAGANDGASGEGDDVTGTVEILLSGSGDDKLTGSDASDEIHGGPGNDTLRGGAGDDSLHGNAGNDSLFGDEGDDSLFGDDGTDHMEGAAGSDLLDGGAGSDFYDAGDGDGDVCLVDVNEEPTLCELY